MDPASWIAIGVGVAVAIGLMMAAAIRLFGYKKGRR
jgi:hypothetical protein